MSAAEVPDPSGTDCTCVRITPSVRDSASKGCPIHGLAGASGGYISIAANQRVKREDEAAEIKRSTHPTPCSRCPVRSELQARGDAACAERDRLRGLIEQFLSEVGGKGEAGYEEMFVSELRDRVGDFLEVAGAYLGEGR